MEEETLYIVHVAHCSILEVIYSTLHCSNRLVLTLQTFRIAKQHTSAMKVSSSNFQDPKQKAASHTAVYMLNILITCWSGLVIMMWCPIVNVLLADVYRCVYNYCVYLYKLLSATHLLVVISG